MGKLPASACHASALDLQVYSAAACNVAPTVATHGFAIVHNAISEESCAAVLCCCAAIADEMLRIDVKRYGNRGRGRYSMGSAAASGQQLHNAAWALLLTDPVLDALESIYGDDGYVLRGGGGEVVLGGVEEYQDLHADVSQVPPDCDTQLRPPVVIVNFAVHPISEDHGPTRIWPAHGRPRHAERPMRQDFEPPDVLRLRLAPLPLGSCVVRDARIWHGGTPNHRTYPRFLPNLEFFSCEYARHIDAQGGRNRFNSRTMTQEVFGLLPPRARRAASGLVSTSEVPRGIKHNFVRPQGSAFCADILSKLAGLNVGGMFSHVGNGYECHQIREMSESRGLVCQIHREGRKCTITVQRVC